MSLMVMKNYPPEFKADIPPPSGRSRNLGGAWPLNRTWADSSGHMGRLVRTVSAAALLGVTAGSANATVAVQPVRVAPAHSIAELAERLRAHESDDTSRSHRAYSLFMLCGGLQRAQGCEPWRLGRRSRLGGTGELRLRPAQLDDPGVARCRMGPVLRRLRRRPHPNGRLAERVPSGRVRAKPVPAGQAGVSFRESLSTVNVMPARRSRSISASPIATAVVTWPETSGRSSVARQSADSPSILAVSS